jgi:hypothetical protein
MGFKEALARNLRQPKGFLGRLTGLFMNKGNDYMNRFTIRLLDPQPGADPSRKGRYCAGRGQSNLYLI